MMHFQRYPIPGFKTQKILRAVGNNTRWESHSKSLALSQALPDPLPEKGDMAGCGLESFDHTSKYSVHKKEHFVHPEVEAGDYHSEHSLSVAS